MLVISKADDLHSFQSFGLGRSVELWQDPSDIDANPRLCNMQAHIVQTPQTPLHVRRIAMCRSWISNIASRKNLNMAIQ